VCLFVGSKANRLTQAGLAALTAHIVPAVSQEAMRQKLVSHLLVNHPPHRLNAHSALSAHVFPKNNLFQLRKEYRRR
jgi:hypothetical protein